MQHMQTQKINEKLVVVGGEGIVTHIISKD